MKVVPTSLPDVLLLEPRVFEDPRGWFFESFNQKSFFEATGLDARFVQDNLSRSAKNVLRGLHYQVAKPQGKLVSALRGEIHDVVVDLRRSSKTFRQWAGFRLTDATRAMAWIPPGFAHGFLVLSEIADVLYKVTEYWHAEHERTIAWNDAELAIPWPLAGAPVLSARDAAGARFAEAELYP